jgi:hypothetical protein
VLTTLGWIVALIVVAILAVSTVAGMASDEPPTDDRSDHPTEHPPTSQGH